MTLRKFREEYQKEVKEMPLFEVDADKIEERGQHYKKIKSKKVIIAASAACAFLVCGVGTVTAMNYGNSAIRIREHGFSFTNNSKALEEETKETGKNDEVSSEPIVTRILPEEVQTRNKKENNEIAMLKEDNGIAVLNEEDGIAVLKEEDKNATINEDESAILDEKNAAVLECKKVEIKTYDSIEEFYQQEDIIIAMPNIEWLGEESEIENVNMIVSEDSREVSLNVYFLSEEKIFSLTQQDNRGIQNYASFYDYMGDAVNERSYCNSQGFEYRIFDSVEDGEVIAVHAAISVNGRDITIDFFDFEEETVKKVLEQLDLSIYL